MEAKACSIRHDSIDALTNSMNEARASMLTHYLGRVCKGFRHHLHGVIDVSSGYID